MGFSDISHPDGLNTISLSQGFVLGVPSGSREGKWKAHSKERGGVEEPPICLGPAHGSTSGYILSMTSPKTFLDYCKET